MYAYLHDHAHAPHTHWECNNGSLIWCFRV